jgi:hypothetical protein
MRIEVYYSRVDLAHTLGRYLLGPELFKSLYIHMRPYGAEVLIDDLLPGFVTARELQDLERGRALI